MNSISNEKVSLVDAIYMEQLNSCINVESALIDYFYKYFYLHDIYQLNL